MDSYLDIQWTLEAIEDFKSKGPGEYKLKSFYETASVIRPMGRVVMAGDINSESFVKNIGVETTERPMMTSYKSKFDDSLKNPSEIRNKKSEIKVINVLDYHYTPVLKNLQVHIAQNKGINSRDR